jgi:hypothetical protein
MKMIASAWRTEIAEQHEYKLQVEDIKHGDKKTFSKLFSEWREFAQGWNNSKNTEIKILVKTFKSEKEWAEWAKKCPVKIVEIKYRAGKRTEIQRSCKTRKKREKNVKAKK